MAAQKKNGNGDGENTWFDNVFGSMFKNEKETSSIRKEIVNEKNTQEGTNKPTDFFSWVGDKASAAVDSLSSAKSNNISSGGGGSSSSSSSHVPSIEASPDAIDAIDVSLLSVKELKDLIKRAGLSDASCFEKADLIEEGKKAKKRLQDAANLRRKNEAISKQSDASKAAKDIAQNHGKHPTRIIAGLECVCVGETNLLNESKSNLVDSPDYIIFCFHGYQATAVSLAPLADVIRSSLEHSFSAKTAHPSSSNRSPRVLVILPQSKGSGWWNIDFTSYAMAMAMGESAKARVLRQVPSGVPECRTLIKTLICESRTLYSIPTTGKPLALSKIYFMGFSQGAMLALDTALNCEEPVGGAVLVSGFLMDVDKWGERLSTTHRNIKVLQLHGINDPLIPFGTAQWLKGLLDNFSNRATFVPHGGGHDIPPHVLTTVCGFLSGVMVE